MLLDSLLEQDRSALLRVLAYALPVLHYGPVVRIGPDHVSYTDPRAWRDIFGHRAGEGLQGREENPKARLFYAAQIIEREGDVPNILTADREEHGRLRRAVAAGFSERAMREQEDSIKGYVDLLVERLRGQSERGNEVDMATWYNWTTFDVVPGFKRVLNIVVRWLAADSFSGMQKNMLDKLRHRLAVKEERSDLFEGLVSKREEWNLTENHLQSNATLLAAAGSETTASLLSGVTYHILANPAVLARLTHEVRTAFTHSSDITIAAVSRLPYLLACLNEALRRHPPTLSNLPREAHEGGESIVGGWVPQGTVLEIQQYAMNHSSQHWHDAMEYRPERWLNKFVNDVSGETVDMGEKDADGDRLEVMQTFSVGPRNCVGRNLAYAEMRLILARMVFEFDMELSESSKDWKQKMQGYTIWEKRPLLVRLTPVKR
ncbi:cytochrome P450 [Chaetomium sp. MPI-SDFR-AT-0129]|nr:cytochrome P450 [Chaetomium sp. MPI-SDFR-AT-0129]